MPKETSLVSFGSKSIVLHRVPRTACCPYIIDPLSDELHYHYIADDLYLIVDI